MCGLRFLLSSGINIADPSYHTWEYFGGSNFNKARKRGKFEKRGCYSLNICIFTSKLIRWNPKVMVLVGEAFKSRVLMNGISALIKKIPQRPLLPREDTTRSLQPRRPSLDHVGTLISDFQPLCRYVLFLCIWIYQSAMISGFYVIPSHSLPHPKIINHFPMVFYSRLF